jgi:hypothetical protein
MRYVVAMVCCIVANFGWQVLSDHAWSVAIERTWFQACAIVAVLLLSTVYR